MQVPLAVIFYFLTDASNNGDWQVTPNGSGTCVPRPIPPFPFSPRPCSQAARPRRALSLPCESGRRLGNPNLWTQICFQTLVMQFVIFFFNLIPAYTFDMGRVLVDVFCVGGFEMESAAKAIAALGGGLGLGVGAYGVIFSIMDNTFNNAVQIGFWALLMTYFLWKAARLSRPSSGRPRPRRRVASVGWGCRAAPAVPQRGLLPRAQVKAGKLHEHPMFANYELDSAATAAAAATYRL